MFTSSIGGTVYSEGWKRQSGEVDAPPVAFGPTSDLAAVAAHSPISDRINSQSNQEPIWAIKTG